MSTDSGQEQQDGVIDVVCDDDVAEWEAEGGDDDGTDALDELEGVEEAKEAEVFEPWTHKLGTFRNPNKDIEVVFSPMAALKYQWFCKAASDTEMCAMCLCETDDPLYVTDFVVLKQHVDGGYCKFDDDALQEFYMKLADEGKPIPWIWAHTHPGGSPEPSVKDWETLDRYFEHREMSVMVIMSRNGFNTHATLRMKTTRMSEDFKVDMLSIDIPLPVVLMEYNLSFRDAMIERKTDFKVSVDVPISQWREDLKLLHKIEWADASKKPDTPEGIARHLKGLPAVTPASQTDRRASKKLDHDRDGYPAIRHNGYRLAIGGHNCCTKEIVKHRWCKTIDDNWAKNQAELDAACGWQTGLANRYKLRASRPGQANLYHPDVVSSDCINVGDVVSSRFSKAELEVVSRSEQHRTMMVKMRGLSLPDGMGESMKILSEVLPVYQKRHFPESIPTWLWSRIADAMPRQPGKRKKRNNTKAPDVVEVWIDGTPPVQEEQKGGDASTAKGFREIEDLESPWGLTYGELWYHFEEITADDIDRIYHTATTDGVEAASKLVASLLDDKQIGKLTGRQIKADGVKETAEEALAEFYGV